MRKKKASQRRRQQKIDCHYHKQSCTFAITPASAILIADLYSKNTTKQVVSFL
jgi:hypothetical protein